METELHNLLNADEPSDFLLDHDGAHHRENVLKRARGIAACLQGLSLAEGARVAIFCRSPRHALEAFYGCLASGTCAVPIHIATPPMAIAHLIADSGATACLTDVPAAELPEVLATIAHINVMTTELPAQPPNAEPVADTALAALLYTSGTTGKPKGIMFSRAGLSALAVTLYEYVTSANPQDTVLMAAPLSNSFGLAIAAMALSAPIRLSLLASLTPTELFETMRRDRVTILLGVPMLAGALLHASGDKADALPDLRRALLAGTWLEPELAQAFSARFGCEVRTGLGMTELPPIAIGVFDPSLPRGTAGFVSPGTEVRVVDEALLDVPDGTPGEALVRGPMLTPGYWQVEAKNSEAFVDGWFRTGDIVVRNPDGRLVLVDRAKEIIKTAGNTVYPSEVEAALIAHPAIAKAAAVGMPHSKMGEIVTAFHTCAPGQSVTTSDLRAWCGERLVSWKTPRKYVETPEMPMTPSGKIAKAQLAASHK